MQFENQANRESAQFRRRTESQTRDGSGAGDLSQLSMTRRGFLGFAFGACASGAAARAQTQGPAPFPPEVPTWDTFAWFPRQLFDEKGYLLPDDKRKARFVLGNGNALQVLISSVREFKEANGGAFPPGYDIRVVTEVNGRMHKDAMLPLNLLPKSVTPDSLALFRSDADGRRALDILSSDYLAVSLFPAENGLMKLEFFKGEIPARLKGNPRTAIPANKTRNHFYLELVVAKPK